MALVLAASPACNEAARGGPSPPGSAAATASLTVATSSAVATSSGESGAGAIHPASRCGECHGALFDEWRGSAHASAGTSVVYQAMLAKAGAEAATCRGCHTPLERFLPATDPAAIEGVSCEACHAIRSVDITKQASGASLARTTYAVADQTKQGPRCDAKPHYFHKMGCAPFFRKAEICAGCHVWSRHPSASVELPIFTEYDDWRKEHYAAEGIGCQDCHMPGLPREVAVGARKLNDVSSHGDLGQGGELRKKAISMEVQVSAGTPKLDVDVTLVNVGAGHAIPTGMPGRQIILRAVSLDANGKERDRAEHVFGRVLVDEAGHEVPFTSAVRELRDERLLPGKPSDDKFKLVADETAGEIVVSVLYRSIPPAIAAALGVPPANDVEMAVANIELGPHARLPKTVKVKP